MKLLAYQTTSSAVRKSKFKSLLALIALFALLSPAVSHARDMQGRLGLGYNAEWANFYSSGGVPSVSLKYGLTRDIATEFSVGVSTANPSNSSTALKLFKNIFYETNLNFYFMVGGAVVSAANAGGGKNTGAEFLGGFGAEFFIPGIESLGFAMETGAELDNLSGSFVFKTLGVSFLNAGIHFYF
jgi:hypothetical protein